MELDLVASRPNVGLGVEVSSPNVGWVQMRPAQSGFRRGCVEVQHGVGRGRVQAQRRVRRGCVHDQHGGGHDRVQAQHGVGHARVQVQHGG